MDLERVERLIDEADERCLPVVSALVEMYGDGLARIVGSLPADSVAQLTSDPLVSHLLILHDLHPVPVEERVRQAIARVGGEADVLAVVDGVARLQAREGSCASCGASAGVKRQAIEEAVANAVPDVNGVEFAEPPEPVLVLPQVSA